MDLKDIKAIIDLMKKNSIHEFELERQEFKIRLKRGGPILAPVITQYEEATQVIATGQSAGALPPGPAAAATGLTDAEIKSPMIGTFYRSPSPESGSYVEIGTEVTPDSVVCIIEAMKVMNEIKAEVKGVITQIVVESGKPVEFGQPMFKVRPT